MFSVVTNWFGLFHVAAVVFNTCHLFQVVIVSVHVVEICLRCWSCCTQFYVILFQDTVYCSKLSYAESNY